MSDFVDENPVDVFAHYCLGDINSVRLKVRRPQSVDHPYLDPTTNELGTALLGSSLDKQRPQDVLEALYVVATSIQGGEHA